MSGNNNDPSHPPTTLTGRLHVVAEHFSFEMDDLLSRYQSSSLSFDEFVAAYKEIGTEGHNLTVYKPMMEFCKQHNDRIQLHGGFIPRPYAAAYMKASTNQEKISLFQQISEEKGYLPNLATLRIVDALLGMDEDRLPSAVSSTELSKPIELYGSPGHYSLFESLLSGRDIYSVDDEECPPPAESYRKIFQAQLVKDWAMANRLHHLINTSPSEDHFLVLAGRAHLSHYHGVPEIFSWLCRANENSVGVIKDEDQLLICGQMMYECDLDERQDRENDEIAERMILKSELIRGSMLGEGCGKIFARPVADVLYVYDEEDWSDEEDEDGNDGTDCGGAAASPPSQGESDDGIKRETIDAYDKVGSTASAKGNVKRARAILTHLGYSQEEQDIIGDDDIYNYQGVGNPFPLARIQKGERVLDLGSGLGIDSFLAAHYTGPEGEVVGVDISKKEVKHANIRATERDASSIVKFILDDVEKLTNVDGEFDAAISNGAFCLAPNKQKAFESVYRILKPGGRMAICTTTVRKDLDRETQWPVCMRMFIHIDKLKPMCEAIGFKNVVVDMEDSALEFELEGISEQEFNESSEERSKIHVGSTEFKHLEGYDMNDLCARVVVYGEK